MRSELPLLAWVDHEMRNWARWCHWSDEPVRHGCDSAERLYRAPDWEAPPPRPLPPNAVHAQKVQRTYDTALHPLERRVVVAEYVRPWDFGRWQYGMAGAARRLKLSLNTYETALRNACRKVEKAFDE
jgi:hypothetical protein